MISDVTALRPDLGGDANRHPRHSGYVRDSVQVALKLPWA